MKVTVEIQLPERHTRETLLACVDREIRYRQRVYPRWVEKGKMTQPQADAHLAAMRAVGRVIEQLPEPAQQVRIPGP